MQSEIQGTTNIDAAGRNAEASPAFRPGTVATYAALNALLALSALLPWERLGFISASGLEVGRGWLVLAAALVAGVMACASLGRGRSIRGLRFAQVLAGVVALLMVGIEIAVLANACQGGSDNGLYATSDFCVQPVMGMGAVLAGIGGLGLGAFAVFRRPSN
jgi:hypothetical protein